MDIVIVSIDIQQEVDIQIEQRIYTSLFSEVIYRHIRTVGVGGWMGMWVGGCLITM